MNKIKTEKLLKKLETFNLWSKSARDFITSLDLTKVQFEIIYKTNKNHLRYALIQHPKLPYYLHIKLCLDESLDIACKAFNQLVNIKKFKTEDLIKVLEASWKWRHRHVNKFDIIKSLNITYEQFKVLVNHEKLNYYITFHPKLPKDLMHLLAKKTNNNNVKFQLIKHPNLSENAMLELIKPSNVREVRKRMAENPLITKKVMYKLSEAEIDELRVILSTHPKLPEKLMYKLSKDEKYSVRTFLAEHRNLPKDLTILLSCGRVSHNEASSKFKYYVATKKIKLDDLQKGYDLTRTANLEHLDKEFIEKTFNYISKELPHLAKHAKMFKTILLKR